MDKGHNSISPEVSYGHHLSSKQLMDPKALQVNSFDHKDAGNLHYVGAKEELSEGGDPK